MANCPPQNSSDTVEPDAPDAYLQTTIVVSVETDRYYVRRRVEASLDGFFFNPHCFPIPIVLAN